MTVPNMSVGRHFCANSRAVKSTFRAGSMSASAVYAGKSVACTEPKPSARRGPFV